MSIATVSARGQLVIPRLIRKQLNISPGKKVMIKVEGDHAILQPLPDNPVDHFCGVFAGDDSLTDALLTERAKEKERESKKAS